MLNVLLSTPPRELARNVVVVLRDRRAGLARQRSWEIVACTYTAERAADDESEDRSWRCALVTSLVRLSPGARGRTPEASSVGRLPPAPPVERSFFAGGVGSRQQPDRLRS